ncbi:MAG: DUF3048 domain-containing protein, partial [Peptococcaceae bacterium]|nr:DUF3048 domain-containing protein [Peptococcaceae bacterium]
PAVIVPSDDPPIVLPKPEPVVQLPAPDLPGVFIASIDNKSEARPQSGLDRADMVIEMIAEAGITRYMAFFHSKAAPLVGPIRSARYYFASIVKAYNTPFAHVGGSTRALNLIAELRIPDLDEIHNASQAFWRDNSRKMPHNLYTSTERMLAEAQRKRLTISPLPRLPEGEMPKGSANSNVSLTYSPYYKVTWQWQDGKYLRSINGKLHTMKDGARLTTDNIVIISTPHRDVVTDVLRTDIDIIGNGPAQFLRDGQQFTGTWKKASANDHFEFMVDGQLFKFKEGVTWIQVVPSMNAVVPSS